MRVIHQSGFRDMANPEKDEKDSDLGIAHTAADGNEMPTEIFGNNEHDILWIDAVADGPALGSADVSDWTQTAAGDATARQATDRWIAAGERSTGDDVLFEDGLALTSIDGLPW